MARTGRPPLYPWDDWLDGSPWELYAGEDYNITADSLVRMARREARNRGKKLASTTTDNGLTLRIQAWEENVDAQ